ncbi:proton-coupled amino acid transporter-like protein CG1139 isoform X2 [Thrips palmi]|uniref:Proton-coupled amino acid transporter-like protein CG1139 isoform X2 n=1 Tax=Thrips palmi TaxID=161013 RepID=A0A6P9AAC9_THRPL|nr:proton-coupled amino acid transporter-like protein CG1139 isoform X2 [Thrips palmi]
MHHDNAGFQYDPNDSASPPARAEKAALDLAGSASVKKGTAMATSQPLPMKSVSGKSRDAEADDYDPFDNRELDHPLTNFDALFHMMKASCGSGILAMPQAFFHAGWALGLGGTAAIGFLCTYCVHILIQSEYAICKRRRVPSLNYHEIAREGFLEGPPIFKKLSKVAERSVHVALGIYEIGSCAVYTVFVSDNLSQVAEQYGAKLDIRLYMCILLLPLILINYIRNLKYLAPFSSFSLVATIIAFGVVLSYIFKDLPNISTVEPVGEVQNWPLFFGTVIFALEAIGVVVPLGNEMRRPREYLGKFGVLNRGMVPIVMLYVFLGFFGYLKYGSNAMASITLNLPQDEIPAQVVKILIAIAIFGTHPLQCYVVIDIVWGTYLQPRFLKHNHVLFIEYVVRTALVLLAFIFAVAVPNLGPIISLVGALSLSVVGIMLPALIQLSTFWYQTHGLAFKWLLTKNALLAVFAVIGLVSGTYASIVDIIATYA